NESASSRSPPTASVSAFRSGIVATTRSLRAASTPGTVRTTAALRRTREVSRFIMVAPLERVRRMGAENERGLEEPFVHEPTAAAVAVEVEQLAMRALGVL